MFDYTKTIINGVKVWCKSEIDRMRTAIEPLIAKAQKTADGAAKSVKTLNSNVQTELDMLYQTVEVAQSTANTAKNTANNAQSTANTAKNTAESAQKAAENSISEERVNELIDAKLGVIENGSY